MRSRTPEFLPSLLLPLGPTGMLLPQALLLCGWARAEGRGQPHGLAGENGAFI